jgi:predicted RNase H-like HicB family nuclease
MPRTQLARTFKVIYEYDIDPKQGPYWLVRIPEVQSCHTDGRSLAEARRNARECLAVCLDDEDRDAIAEAAIFEEEIRMPASMRSAVKRFAKTRAAAAKAKSESVEAARALAETLSLRDAGELLGLSQEGVRQLLKTG